MDAPDFFHQVPVEMNVLGGASRGHGHLESIGSLLDPEAQALEDADDLGVGDFLAQFAPDPVRAKGEGMGRVHPRPDIGGRRGDPNAGLHLGQQARKTGGGLFGQGGVESLLEAGR